MATTTNYGFEIPDDTDLVKDGALAMRDLGQDVDTTLATALNANDYAGLVLVKKQTIGTGVSSVTVSDAFSATYTAYKIIISGGAGSADIGIGLQYGSTATGYYEARPRVTLSGGAVAANTTINGSSFSGAGYAMTSGIAMNLDVSNPFLATNTRQSTNQYVMTTGVMDWSMGALINTTSYTAFTILPSGGTLTGGTIYVYGYGTS
jgi:hypothetical protein